MSENLEPDWRDYAKAVCRHEESALVCEAVETMGNVASVVRYAQRLAITGDQNAQAFMARYEQLESLRDGYPPKLDSNAPAGDPPSPSSPMLDREPPPEIWKRRAIAITTDILRALYDQEATEEIWRLTVRLADTVRDHDELE